MAGKTTKKGAGSKKSAGARKSAGSKKRAASKREGEEPVDLTVTLDGETRAVTLTRMGTGTEVRFANNEVVTVACPRPTRTR
jgi:hypothetical protein